MIYQILFFAAVCLSQRLSEEDYQTLFTEFITTYGKQYSTEDFFNRYNIFKTNVDKINRHNAGDHSWTQGVNQFSDLTGEEWQETYLGYNFEKRVSQPSGLLGQVHYEYDDSVDWTTKGAVTPVKNQGQCGSCWSFSTTGSLEGALQIATGKLTSLSEQNLMDCAGEYGNQGCNGGLMDDAFKYVKAKGLASEASYPYEEKDGHCKKEASVVSITGYEDVKEGDEDALKAAVTKGPVSVAIEADKSAFQSYKSGVLDSWFCGKKLDHGVLVVGYGTDSESGKDYWKVKNSWGADWGEEGYIRMVQGKNMCGIASQPSYPTGASAAAEPQF
jgi:C1A family cysteine protease